VPFFCGSYNMVSKAEEFMMMSWLKDLKIERFYLILIWLSVVCFRLAFFELSYISHLLSFVSHQKKQLKAISNQPFFVYLDSFDFTTFDFRLKSCS
jgi:hypothetical protein